MASAHRQAARCYYYDDDHESWQKTRLCRKKLTGDFRDARVFDVGAAWSPPSGAAAARSTVSWASATSAHGQEQQVVFTIPCRPRAGGDACTV